MDESLPANQAAWIHALVEQALASAEGGDVACAPAVAERVARRIAKAGLSLTEEHVHEVLAHTKLADLCLALGLARADAESWASYASRFRPAVLQSLRRSGLQAGAAEELADALPGLLLEPMQARVASPSRNALDSYEGAGSLEGWMVVVARRRAVDELRRRREAELENEVHAAQVPGPEERAQASEHVEALRAVSRELAAELTPRERLVLQLKFQEEMPQRAIAKALAISDSRVTRLLQHGMDKLGRRLRAYFPGGRPQDFPGLAPLWDEFARCSSMGQKSDSPSDKGQVEPKPPQTGPSSRP